MLPIVISAIENPQDRDLMTDFYTRQKARLYAEAWKYLSTVEDVEDIVFEALAKIIEKMETFRTLRPDQQVQYAVTTIRNLSYILIKRKNLHTMISFDALDYDIEADPGETTEEIVERRIMYQNVAEIWNSLDMEDRLLLEQKYILQWPDAELAEGLGIKAASVRMRLTRAKRNVMAQMQKKGFQIIDWI